MLPSIPPRQGTRRQLLTAAEPGARAPEMLLPVPWSGQAAPALPPRSPHHLGTAPSAELGEPSGTSHRQPGQGSDPG